MAKVYTTIDKETVREIRQIVQAALNIALEAKGLKAEVGNAVFDTAGKIDFKLAVKVAGVDLDRANFDRVAPSFGLSSLDYNKKFTFQGTAYWLRGFNLRASRFPIKVVNGAGRPYKLSTKALEVLKPWSKLDMKKITGEDASGIMKPRAK